MSFDTSSPNSPSAIATSGTVGQKGIYSTANYAQVRQQMAEMKANKAKNNKKLDIAASAGEHAMVAKKSSMPLATIDQSAFNDGMNAHE